MQASILNTSFELVKVIDSFESFIWTDRYSSHGDFEIYLPIDADNISSLLEDYYVTIRDSDHMMIIEDIQITSDVDNGPQLYVSGRSLESILSRRIIWSQTFISGNLQNAIEKLLNENIISPTDEKRRIDNFIFEVSTDEAVTSLKLSGQAQFTGDNLYDVIVSLCDIFGIGFRITLSSDNKFVFKLYAGSDRSYEQTTNPYVIFAPNFENLLNSSYISSKKNLKNVTLILGQGEGDERKTTSLDITNGSVTGLDRRELYTDARDVSKNAADENGQQTPLPDEEYEEQLIERGREKLAECVAIQSFEGESDPNTTFKYGTEKEIKDGTADYSIGDIVQIINEYGMEARSRITEVIRSESSSGFEIYPTFTQIA